MAGAARRAGDAARRRTAAIDPAALAAADHAAHAACCCSTRRTTRPARCFSRAELELIAAACVEHDLLAVTDEVYEHLVYDGEHVPLATLPGMAERTLTISSARQDVLGDGLEDRLGDRPARARRGGARRPSSS